MSEVNIPEFLLNEFAKVGALANPDEEVDHVTRERLSILLQIGVALDRAYRNDDPASWATLRIMCNSVNGAIDTVSAKRLAAIRNIKHMRESLLDSRSAMGRHFTEDYVRRQMRSEIARLSLIDMCFRDISGTRLRELLESDASPLKVVAELASTCGALGCEGVTVRECETRLYRAEQAQAEKKKV